MNIKPIRTETDYQSALHEIDRLFGAEPGTPEGDELDILIALVERYENEHYQIPLPDPIKAIEYHMERLNLSRRDLEPYIGTRARVSEIINRRRPLTLRMIRNLSKGIGISTDVLVKEYDLIPSEDTQPQWFYYLQNKFENNVTVKRWSSITLIIKFRADYTSKTIEISEIPNYPSLIPGMKIKECDSGASSNASYKAGEDTPYKINYSTYFEKIDDEYTSSSHLQ